MATKTRSLAHTKWLCEYHIVFTPEYRRQVIYNQYRNSLREILRHLCEYNGVKIIEGKVSIKNTGGNVDIIGDVNIPKVGFGWGGSGNIESDEAKTQIYEKDEIITDKH